MESTGSESESKLLRPETEERKALEEEAASWLARLDAGTATPDSFEVWRSADPAHAAAFLRVMSLWMTLDQAKLHAASEQSLPELMSTDVMSVAHRYDRRKILFASLGGLAVLAGSGFIATRGYAKGASTETGERRIVRLEDGGSVELNTQSAVSWQINDEQRYIKLERGEIALTVPPARLSYCRLEAAGCLVDLSPGQYGARVRDDRLHLFVIEGLAVARPEGAANAGPPVRLAPAQTAIFGATNFQHARLTDDDIASLSAWQRGEIILQGQTLDEAVADYNRYLTKKIVLVTPQLSRLRLGGRFLTSQPDAFLHALSTQFGAHVQIDDRNILVTL